MMIASQNPGCSYIDEDGDKEQGFLDDNENFLSRKDALSIALACGQVKNVDNIRAQMLFSEDLW
jgi:hypothetical protein